MKKTGNTAGGGRWLLCTTALVSSLGGTGFAWSDDFDIDRARWNADRNVLAVRGGGDDGERVRIANAYDPTQDLGSRRVSGDDWKVRVKGLETVPCRVRATQSDGSVAEADVRNAPANCASGGPVTPPPPPVVDNGGPGPQPPPGSNIPSLPPLAPDVSINSTSQNSAESGVDPNAGPVPEEPFLGNSSHTVLAINDLGMHCGDLDTRVASILPPFQVLLAQVIRRDEEPDLLGPGQAEVLYSAVSNPDDPILENPNAFTGVAPDGSVFKTNFWDIASKAYGPFYPPGILDAFYDPDNPDANKDIGLPVPNVEELYIGHDGQIGSGDEGLVATQHAMPGMTAPYLDNAPQLAEEF